MVTGQFSLYPIRLVLRGQCFLSARRRRKLEGLVGRRQKWKKGFRILQSDFSYKKKQFFFDFWKGLTKRKVLIKQFKFLQKKIIFKIEEYTI